MKECPDCHQRTVQIEEVGEPVRAWGGTVVRQDWAAWCTNADCDFQKRWRNP